MKFASRRPALSAGLVCILAVILMALAVLQVRWTGQVSQADRERMQTNLHTAVMRFRRDFYLQLMRICWAFEPPADGFQRDALKFYAGRYDDWMSASARPALVEGLFIWDRAGNRLFRLDPAEGRFKPTPWPQEFARLRYDLEQPVSASLANAPSDTPIRSWTLDEASHALSHPFTEAPRQGSLPQHGVPSFARGVIVELNVSFIWHTLTPELIARYFRGPGGTDYVVSIISPEDPPKVFYQSAPAPLKGPVLTGDMVENLLAGQESDSAAPPAAPQLNKDKKDAVEEGASGVGNARDLIVQTRRSYLPLVALNDEGGAWRLVVRHRSGSVEAAVKILRRRNLTVSFSVLLLLAVSMALIVVSAQRAHRLATLQMDFMAGVSHELRTPLAVICSAAENLADGVVGTTDQVKNYGVLIRDEGRRLSEMVGQVLVFAADQAGQRPYHRRPLDMGEVIEDALASVQPALESEKVVVEKRMERDMPLVMGDASALGRCIQNLISNAVKYGGADRWVGVRAEKTRARGCDELMITVEDHGLGIDHKDLPHIFEPFYRGKNGGAPQVHGTGLGLSLAKDIAETMGGRLSVKTTPSKGSRFTLHLPALPVAHHETPPKVS